MRGADHNGTCTTPPTGTPTYTYVYDRFGNRWQQNGPNSMQLSFTGNNSTNNNQMDSYLTGFTYDWPGNLLFDGTHQYFYDAENRLIQVDGTLPYCTSNGASGSPATACYLYDAEGRRVHRTGMANDVCDGTGESDFAFDLEGHWTTQTNSIGGGCKSEIYIAGHHFGTSYSDITFDHIDWLGTSRLRNSLTNLTSGYETCTSLPFGDALTCNSTFSSNIHFTSKERDYESGLDNFDARYNSSNLGRFTSPDPLLNSGHPADPQTWNRYSYVLNNPLRYTDPLGLYVWGNCTRDPDKCKAEQQRFRDSIAKAQEALKGLDPNSKEAKALRSALNKLGEEGKGDIKINFGDAGTDKNGNPYLGTASGHNITINYDAVDAADKRYNLNASESAALDAGLTTHEATHDLGNGLKGLFQGHFEHAAYYTESVTYQGLHNTDRPFQLWNESWLTVDQHQFPVEKTREQAIQHNIHPDTVPAPVVPPSGSPQ